MQRVLAHNLIQQPVLPVPSWGRQDCLEYAKIAVLFHTRETKLTSR